MNGEAICRFIPRRESNEFLHTINFVLETKPQTGDTVNILPYYRLHYVRCGRAKLLLPGREEPLSAGDVFFAFPAVPYSLETEDGFRYMYISFMGSRANRIADELGLCAERCLFPGMGGLGAIWNGALEGEGYSAELRSEGLLLYTLSLLERKNPYKSLEKKQKSAALDVKRYIDEHFSAQELNLRMIGDALGLHPKYVSTVFKRRFGVGTAEYVNTVRIRRACALMEQGISGVRNVAELCGYGDAMYFSRVFKKQMGIPPKEYGARFT